MVTHCECADCRLRMWVSYYAGDLARSRRECRKQGKLSTGKPSCSQQQYCGCDFELPALDPYRVEVVQTFLAVCGADLWVVAGMGSRQRIDRKEMQLEARVRGLDPWSEYFLDKFQICEGVIKRQESDRAEAAREKTT